MFRKVWTDPVLSKVIAAAIVAAGATTATYFAGWWPHIVAFINYTGAIARLSTPVPNWLLVVLVLSAVIVLFLTGIAVWAALFSSGNGPSLQSYVDDVILGIRWRWRYRSDGTIYDLVSFCPRCDYQIFPRTDAGYRAIESIVFKCEDCGTIAERFDVPLDEVESRVVRHIQKNLRTGGPSKLVDV